MSELTDMNKAIEEVETEIRNIENEIIDQEAENTRLRQWRDYQYYGMLGADSNKTIENLNYQVEVLSKHTGIVIIDCKTEILFQDDFVVKKRKFISGNCDNIIFDLHMDMKESMDSDGKIQSYITNLSISVSDDFYTDLKQHVDKLSNDCNAQGFFNLLRPYNKWNKARDVTYQHFMKKYPKIVSRPDIHTLHMSHTKKKCTFEISWGFKVTDTYNILPDIKLTLQIPKKVKDSNYEVVESIPDKFHLMLEQLGIEKTFNTLVSLLT
ncbi:hypothetical protein ACF0H5_014162 [Mactra antiquata]